MAEKVPAVRVFIDFQPFQPQAAQLD